MMSKASMVADTGKGEDGKFTQVEGSEMFYPHKMCIRDSTGDAQQTGLLVQDLVQLVASDVQVVLQVVDHRGVDIAATGTHCLLYTSLWFFGTIALIVSLPGA